MERPNDDAYKRAEKRVAAKMSWFIHLAVYLGVNTLLTIINLATEPAKLWFYWPLMGWGVGLLFHGLGVFVFPHGRASALKERLVQKELQREQEGQDPGT